MMVVIMLLGVFAYIFAIGFVMKELKDFKNE